MGQWEAPLRPSPARCWVSGTRAATGLSWGAPGSRGRGKGGRAGGRMSKTGRCLHRTPGVPLAAPHLSGGRRGNPAQKEETLPGSSGGGKGRARRRRTPGVRSASGPPAWGWRGAPGEHPDFWVWRRVGFSLSCSVSSVRGLLAPPAPRGGLAVSLMMSGCPWGWRDPQRAPPPTPSRLPRFPTTVPGLGPECRFLGPNLPPTQPAWPEPSAPPQSQR